MLAAAQYVNDLYTHSILTLASVLTRECRWLSGWAELRWPLAAPVKEQGQNTWASGRYWSVHFPSSKQYCTYSPRICSPCKTLLSLFHLLSPKYYVIKHALYYDERLLYIKQRLLWNNWILYYGLAFYQICTTGINEYSLSFWVWL